MVIFIFANSAGTTILSGLYAIKPLKYVKICHVPTEKIRHFVTNTELFLRRLQLGILSNEEVVFIGFAQTNPVNKQLLKMLISESFIVEQKIRFSWRIFYEVSI